VANPRPYRPAPPRRAGRDRWPFIESKEILGGFIVLDVADMDEATALAAEWPSLRHAGSVVQVQAVETG